MTVDVQGIPIEVAILHDLVAIVLPDGQFAVAGNSYGGFFTDR